MGRRFAELAFTPLVKEQQKKHGSRASYARVAQGIARDGALGDNEREYIAIRDSFYMASVSETGWPYIQHRGGEPGFLRVVDDKTLTFADLSGNRQYVSLGNLLHDNRVALFLMDYPRQTRLKILGRVEILEATPETQARIRELLPDQHNDSAERVILIHVEAFDWNCPQHITPRYTQAELAEALEPMRQRLEMLEEENRRLRAVDAVIPSA